jgi:molybdenum cofactor cytidylyltransferase
MGRPKQLAEIGGRSLLQWVVDAAEASRLDRIVVVTGSGAEEVRRAVRLSRAGWAHNPEPERGTMSSLRAGVAEAGEPDAIMKLVADQPEMASAVIDALIDARDPARFDVLVAAYRGEPGHPLLFESGVLRGLIDQDGDRLLWEHIERNPERVQRIAVDSPAPIDVNAPADLERVGARLRGFSS